jgi:hypothetical protein
MFMARSRTRALSARANVAPPMVASRDVASGVLGDPLRGHERQAVDRPVDRRRPGNGAVHHG